MTTILITGSAGLVGRALRRALEARGHDVRGLDLRSSDAERGDVRDRGRVDLALRGVHGVIHLAAVSRVIQGEQNPDLCWATNVGGLRHVLELALSEKPSPWVIFASSREVYGEPDSLPVVEDTPLRPMNVYGRSKVEGERMVSAAHEGGLRASIIRLSNVYGSTSDHVDRVVPAFARGAALGRPLRVDGADHTFDFTHLDDTTRGIVALVEHFINGGDAPPPVHFVTGHPTTLLELANLAIEIAAAGSSVHHAPPRSYDVSRFYGCPDRARDLLGWSPRVSLREGLKRLIQDFRNEVSVADEQALPR